MIDEDIVVMMDSHDDPEDNSFLTANHVLDNVMMAFLAFEAGEEDDEFREVAKSASANSGLRFL
jgi:nitrate reductase NapAB chaperone NapD